MGKILQGRYDRLLRRTTAQVGFGSKVGEALEDLFPVLDVERAPMELLRAAGWKFGWGRKDRTSAVANTNTQQLFNPVGSGHLIVITRLTITAFASTQYKMGPGFVAFAGGPVPGAERDLRIGQASSMVGTLQHLDDAAITTFYEVRISNNATYEMADQNGIAVLAPGTGFVVNQETTNDRMITSFLWRERVAEPEELNF